MQSRSALSCSLVTVGLFVVLAGAAACGGSVVGPGDTAGGGSGGNGSEPSGGSGGALATGGSGGASTLPGGGTEPTALARPPAPPSGGSDGDGPGVTLAISAMFPGDTTWDGTPSAEAWSLFGYDIDGEVSSKSSTNHCQPAPGGAVASIRMDGPGGLDNSWGRNVVPMMVGVMVDFSSVLDENIRNGEFTSMFAIDAVGNGAAYTSLNAAMYRGAPLGYKPSWTPLDQWPVACEGLTTCLASGTPAPPANASKYPFLASYVSGGVWVSGAEASELEVPMLFLDYPIILHLRQARVTMALAPGDDAPSGATRGIISGVVATDDLVSRVTAIGGYISTSLCEGPTMESVTTQLRAASDIMADGTQNPGATCDGISVGLGFEAKAVSLGAARDKQPPPPDPCAYY